MFILDIRIIMNDDTIINLEMQLSNEGNWPERSLGYLCRNFDNLNRGNDYIDTKPAIHIGFLAFTLFPDFPEFHATYELQNLKNHHIYTDKFMLHVIELNHIHLATEEDRAYETDKWASFFKISTWEDMRMLSKKSLTFEQAAETLYQINMDVQLRNELERYERAQARENGIKLLKQKQAQTQEQLEQLLLEKKQLEMDNQNHLLTIDDQQSTIDDQKSTIDNQQSTIDDQKSTIDNQQSTIDDQKSTIEQLRNEIKLLQSK